MKHSKKAEARSLALLALAMAAICILNGIFAFSLGSSFGYLYHMAGIVLAGTAVLMIVYAIYVLRGRPGKEWLERPVWGISKKYNLKSPLKTKELFMRVGWLKLVRKHGKKNASTLFLFFCMPFSFLIVMFPCFTDAMSCIGPLEHYYRIMWIIIMEVTLLWIFYVIIVPKPKI